MAVYRTAYEWNKIFLEIEDSLYCLYYFFFIHGETLFEAAASTELFGEPIYREDTGFGTAGLVFPFQLYHLLSRTILGKFILRLKAILGKMGIKTPNS